MHIELEPSPVLADQFAELRAHLRLPAGPELAAEILGRLESSIEVASNRIERRSGRVLLRRNAVVRLETWPSDPQIRLPIFPARRVVSVACIARDGSRSPQAVELLSLHAALYPSRLFIARGFSPPLIEDGGFLEIIVEAGYGDGWSDTPVDLRQAVILLAAAIFDDAPEQNADAISAMLHPYKSFHL